METKLISSLEKVFADEKLTVPSFLEGTMLKNELFSFQLAYKSTRPLGEAVKVHVKSPLAPWVRIYKVGLIPVELPVRWNHDENVLRTTPGLYPDLLEPIQDGTIPILPCQWRSLWITVRPEGNIRPGTYPVEIKLKASSGSVLSKDVFHLEVIDLNLPPQRLIHTEWLHTDCIATWYRTPVFSPEHWRRLEQYIKKAVDHGINMILTPLFTPPLDTAVGGERPTVQLVDVEKNGDSYRFGFNKLHQWVEMCNRLGIEYFEFSHLFTQWGAAHAPKIMALVDGKLQQIFGWETDAASFEYKDFLDQFLPQLVKFITEHGLKERCYFHISDEPSLHDLAAYKSASEIMGKHLADFPIMDALSNYEFYETGLVKNPIPASDHIEPFLEHEVPNLWTYYCSAQERHVSQRFFSMPSARNRILGLQLYKFNIVGFLHWGFNFYYSQYSKYPIDPFRVTDGGYWVPAGDTFLVYPGADGPLPSIRLKVLYEGLQDLQALQLLEQYIGRDQVLTLLEEDLSTPLTFREYPTDAEWLLAKRQQINYKLARFATYS